MTDALQKEAREAAEAYEEAEEWDDLDDTPEYHYENGYLVGHASRDEEVKAKDESIDVYYITASDDDIFYYEDGDPEEMLYVKRSDHLADKNAALAAKIDEISILSAKLAAMREPLWMLRSEHEAETAELRSRLESAEAKLRGVVPRVPPEVP